MDLVPATTGQKFIVCLPQPLVHLDPVHAFLQGKSYSDGMDESFHPINRQGAEIVSQLLSETSRKHKVFVASGDVHWAYMQDHYERSIGGSVFTELVTSGITRTHRGLEPWKIRFGMWIQRNFNFLRCATRARNRREQALDHSYGSLRNDLFSITTAGSKK